MENRQKPKETAKITCVLLMERKLLPILLDILKTFSVIYKDINLCTQKSCRLA